MLMRRCEACRKPIEQKLVRELQVRVLKSEGSETQDAVEQCYGEYCDSCILSGKAIKDLLSGLKYKPVK